MLVENNSVPFDRRVWLEATYLRDKGYTVTIICPTGDRHTPGYEYLEDIHVYRYSLKSDSHSFLDYVREYGIALLKTLYFSIKAVRHPGFEVIHACNPPDLFFLIGCIFKLFGKKFVFDQHDLAPEIFLVKRYGSKGIIYRLLLALEWLTYQTADLTIVTNESMREIARERGAVNAGRIFVVRTGPDLSRFNYVTPDETLKEGARHLVCYLGLMGPQDGVDYGLRAAAWLVHTQQRRDIHFTFIGAGDALPGLKELAAELHLDDFVTFTGLITDDRQLCTYLSTADVCITPDPQNGVNEFNTMIKTLEYMAIGKPQVAFALAETRRSAGDAALYAKPNDIEEFGQQILNLLDDPDRSARLGQLGRQRIEADLSWQKSSERLGAAYVFLCNGAKEGAAI